MHCISQGYSLPLPNYTHFRDFINLFNQWKTGYEKKFRLFALLFLMAFETCKMNSQQTFYCIFWPSDLFMVNNFYIHIIHTNINQWAPTQLVCMRRGYFKKILKPSLVFVFRYTSYTQVCRWKRKISFYF